MYYAHREISIPKLVSLARQLFFTLDWKKTFHFSQHNVKEKSKTISKLLFYRNLEKHENSSPQGFVVDIYKLLSQLKSYTGTHGLTT